MVKLTQEMETFRTGVSEDDLRPIVEGFARAASHSQEAFLELAMCMPHVRRVMPDFDEALGFLITGAFQSWQTIEEGADDALGAQIITARPDAPRIDAERV